MQQKPHTKRFKIPGSGEHIFPKPPIELHQPPWESYLGLGSRARLPRLDGSFRKFGVLIIRILLFGLLD